MESSLRGHYQQHQQQQHQNYPPTNSSRSALSSSLSGQHRSGHQQQYHHQSRSHQMSDYASVGSHYSRGSHASSQQSSQVDEAARRLGHRLSMTVHGDQPVSRPQRLSRVGMTPKSGFVRFRDRPRLEEDGVEIDGNSQTVSTARFFNIHRLTRRFQRSWSWCGRRQTAELLMSCHYNMYVLLTF
jgi:hypothetical protein